VSWPYGPSECPRCRYFEPLEPPGYDEAGYEVVGFCLHPRIGMDLFLFKLRDQDSVDSCPCFRAKPKERKPTL